jgi:hypothetical protein
VIALLALSLLAGSTPAPDWFRAVQYAARPAALRGCAECAGEPDDVCEVRAGAQQAPLDDYAQQRWPARDRIRLLRPSAEAGCAVAAKSLFGPRATVDLAAVRMAPSPPSQALLDAVQLRAPVHGWPRPPQRREKAAASTAAPDRASSRLAVVCWPAERGWPARELDGANSCEWWLLPVTAAGEPDLAGASVALAEPAFPAGDPKWARAFDRTAPLDESLFFAAPAPQPQASATRPAPTRCGDAAREHAATLDRFDQWDRQLRGAEQPSLDRTTLTLGAAAWAGHCQELEVLHAALERQLDCTVALEGTCQ